MSVAMMLGVDDVEAPVMMAARNSWKCWTERESALGVVEDLLGLPEWTLGAEPEPKDAVLRSLAKLGAADGGNDNSATTALTWLLVPGAAAIAYRLSDLAHNIDELVASHLWTSAKTFAWDRRRATAASILRDTRRGVLAEVGVGESARRQDRTWTLTACVQPESPTWSTWSTCTDEDATDSLTELTELLDEAVCAQVLTDADCEFLFDLAVVADRIGTPARRGRAGLMVPAVSDEIGRRWGMASRTVRRQAAESIDRLIDFSARCDNDQPAAVAIRAGDLALGA